MSDDRKEWRSVAGPRACPGLEAVSLALALDRDLGNAPDAPPRYIEPTRCILIFDAPQPEGPPDAVDS